MTNKLNEAIETLKDYRKGDFVDDYKLCEAIDTVVSYVEKPLPTDDEIYQRANEVYPFMKRDDYFAGAKWMRDQIRKEATE